MKVSMKKYLLPFIAVLAVTTLDVVSGWASPVPVVARRTTSAPFHFSLSALKLQPRRLYSSAVPSTFHGGTATVLQMIDSTPDSPPTVNLYPRTSKLNLFKSTTIIVSLGALLFWKRQALLTSIHFIKDEWLITTLDRLNAAGPTGLLIYAVAFLVWEMTFGMTTPVETSAGMAFGVGPGILASGIAKFTGALLTFLLARYRFKQKMQQRMQGNELLELMEESIQETPFRVALLCRFSPLPEFVKNAGMGILPLPRRWFIASLLIHGFSFTCLWTCVGAETANVLLRGMPPSSTLKVLLTGATWIGFGAPVGITLWIKSLKDKQRERRRRTLTTMDPTSSTTTTAPLSSTMADSSTKKDDTSAA